MSKLNSLQQTAYKTILNGHNVFLTGKAGSGKSYVLQQVMHHFDQQHVNYYVTAPTGIAALNINGTTIHHFLRIRPDDNLLLPPSSKSQRQINELFNDDHHLVIVDEISMCSSALFTYFMRALRQAEVAKHVNIQVVLVGDFSQLPPVVRRGSLEQRLMKSKLGGYYSFQTPAWQELNLQTIILQENIRQTETAFTNALNKIRLGDSTGINYINQHANSHHLTNAITLCGTNRTAESINHQKLAQVNAPTYSFNANISGFFSNQPTYRNLQLKVGARVMTITNGQDQNHTPFVNGALGTITKIILPKHHMFAHNFTAPQFATNDHHELKKQPQIKIQLDNGNEIIVSYHTWNVYHYVSHQGKIIKELTGTFTQLPLKLAYAITIHKSQGQTYDQVNFDPQIFADGQCYVGISRVRTINGLHLIKPLADNMVRTNQAVMDFYHENRYFAHV